jgi:hypothetical protein
MWDAEEVFAECVGLTVENVDTSVPKLLLSNGKTLVLELEGEAGSGSTYTDPDQFKELLGAKIQSIEERTGPADIPGRDYSDGQGADCVSWHFLVFKTDKGHVTVDWRNDSNGYYDGWVEPKLQDPE